MKALIVLLCLFMVVPGYGVDNSSSVFANQMLLEDKETLRLMKELRDSTEKNIRFQRRMDVAGTVLGVGINIGIGVWGINQNSTFGTVAGIIFMLRGLNILWKSGE